MLLRRGRLFSEFFQYRDIEVKEQRDHRADPPADGPGPENALHAEYGGKDKGKRHAQDQVGKGAYHKAEVAAAAAHRAVGRDF